MQNSQPWGQSKREWLNTGRLLCVYCVRRSKKWKWIAGRWSWQRLFSGQLCCLKTGTKLLQTLVSDVRSCLQSMLESLWGCVLSLGTVVSPSYCNCVINCEWAHCNQWQNSHIGGEVEMWVLNNAKSLQSIICCVDSVLPAIYDKLFISSKKTFKIRSDCGTLALKSNV